MNLPGSCSRAEVTVTFQKIVPRPEIGLVKTGFYSRTDETVTYTFLIINRGNVPLQNMVIDDERIGISNLEIEDILLAPGETATTEAVYEVEQSDLNDGRIINSAKVTGHDFFGNVVEDISGTAPDNDEPTVTVIEQMPVIEIEKTAEMFSSKAIVNEVVSFNILIKNSGNVELENVILTDPLTGFEQHAGTMQPGEVLNYNTSYTVMPEDEIKGSFENVAYVSVTVANGAEIERSSSVTVPVEQCELVIPNGFSPNDDGIQDEWKIKCIEKYPNARVEIFNRWGNKVFEKDNFGNTDVHGDSDAWWNGYSTNKGTFGKEKLPSGTYYYILNLNDGNKSINGFIFMNW